MINENFRTLFFFKRWFSVNKKPGKVHQQETWEGTSTLIATKSSPINYCPFLPKEKTTARDYFQHHPPPHRKGDLRETRFGAQLRRGEFRCRRTYSWVVGPHACREPLYRLYQRWFAGILRGANVHLSYWSTSESGAVVHPDLIFLRISFSFNLIVVHSKLYRTLSYSWHLRRPHNLRFRWIIRSFRWAPQGQSHQA